MYFHQLAALRAGHSVEEVFADDTEVHHWYPIKEWNVPENVEVLHIEEHGERHRDRFPDRHELRGRE